MPGIERMNDVVRGNVEAKRGEKRKQSNRITKCANANNCIECIGSNTLQRLNVDCKLHRLNTHTQTDVK